MSFEDTVSWFGSDGLGLPLPALMAVLATGAELLGGLFLAVGFAVRPIAVPLMLTMLVAIVSVHWPNGWLAVAEPQGLFANRRTMEAAERLSQIKAILREHGDYERDNDDAGLVGVGHSSVLRGRRIKRS